MLSRRNFLASLSALAGTSAHLSLSPLSKASAQEAFPDHEIQKELRKIYGKPTELPDVILTSTLDGIDANLSKLGLYRELIGQLAGPADAAPMVSALDDTIAALNASRGEIADLFAKVETDGFPRKTDKYEAGAAKAGQVFTNAFQPALAAWTLSNPNAALDVPLAIINDPRYLPIISLVCDPSSYGGGHTCPPAGEFLTEISAAVNPLVVILLVAAAIFAIAIWLILLFTDDPKTACAIAHEAIKLTVDNKDIPDDQHSTENYTTIVKKAFKDAGLSNEQIRDVNKCVQDERAKEKNLERQERLQRLSNAMANSTR